MHDSRRSNRFFLLPITLVAILFVALPLIYVVGLSFLSRGEDGYTITMVFTTENYQRLFNPTYARVFLNSLALAFWTTFISFIVGYPFGYCMARSSARMRMILMLLVIVPFWTNALVRIYGWKILLQANGPINSFLQFIGVIEKPIKMAGSYFAVLLAMVYSLIPFMILPCYSSVEKVDWSYVEALSLIHI